MIRTNFFGGVRFDWFASLLNIPINSAMINLIMEDDQILVM